MVPIDDTLFFKCPIYRYHFIRASLFCFFLFLCCSFFLKLSKMHQKMGVRTLSWTKSCSLQLLSTILCWTDIAQRFLDSFGIVPQDIPVDICNKFMRGYTGKGLVIEALIFQSSKEAFTG